MFTLRNSKKECLELFKPLYHIPQVLKSSDVFSLNTSSGSITEAVVDPMSGPNPAP